VIVLGVAFWEGAGYIHWVMGLASGPVGTCMVFVMIKTGIVIHWGIWLRYLSV